jgi:hypothetical protein
VHEHSTHADVNGPSFDSLTVCVNVWVHACLSAGQVVVSDCGAVGNACKGGKTGRFRTILR